MAALRFAMHPVHDGKTVVTRLPDTGRNDLSRIFNDDWTGNQGLL